MGGDVLSATRTLVVVLEDIATCCHLVGADTPRS
jgi:hypothetical protein